MYKHLAQPFSQVSQVALTSGLTIVSQSVAPLGGIAKRFLDLSRRRNLYPYGQTRRREIGFLFRRRRERKKTSTTR